MGVGRENVERMMTWLAEGGPARSASSAAETVVAELAVVFGGDAGWPAETDRTDSYQNALSAWLESRSGGEARFAALTAADADPGAFADAFLPLFDAPASAEAGGADAAGATGAAEAFSNPNFDGTPGTEFYRLGDGGQYLYAASADGADWVTYEERRYAGREHDENYGLDYRYDRTGSVYEWYDEADGTWKSQAWADAHVASGKEAAAASTASAESTTLTESTTSTAQPPAEAAAEWDENWAMFYRVGPSGVYEFADAVTPGDRSSGSGDVWLGQEQVLARNASNPAADPERAADPAAAAAADPAAAAEAEAKPVEPQLEQVQAEVRATVDSVIADMPELMEGLSREDLESVIADLAKDVISSQ